VATTSTENKTVVGLFDDFQSAQRAAERLESAGIARGNISIIAGNESGKYEQYVSGTGEVGKDTAKRAGTGAAIGGGLGLLAGLTALVIPGVGPIIAAGPIAAALTGAGVGAAAGGLIGGLTKGGISEPDANYYAEGVRRGGVLVMVRTSDDMADKAAEILDDAGAKDVDEKVREWRSSGWTPSGTVSSSEDVSVSAQQSTSRQDVEGIRSVPVIKEELRVGKRKVKGGGVRIYSHVETEPVEEQVTLRDENVTVERRQVNRAATEADFSASKEGTIELTETHEEPVVQKAARVVEEITAKKDVTERTEKVRDSVRRTDVKVEKLGSTPATIDYENDSRYAPAHKLGSTWAGNEKYRGRDWDAVEPDLRRDWESRGQGAWEDFKDAIRHGWDKVRGRR
jgi:uncharacterized protein (TIGR02271 family)